MNNAQIIEYTKKILTEGLEQTQKKSEKEKIANKPSPQIPEITTSPHIINNIVIPSSHHFEIIILCLFILIYPFLEYHRPPKDFTKMQFKETFTQREEENLSQKEIKEFQNLIKKVALKENTSVQKIHHELKKIYHYQYYREINPSLYFKIKQYLEERLHS